MDRVEGLRGRRRPVPSEVLLPGDVRLSIGPRARRARPQLHHRRRDGTHEADARLQRAASLRLGRIRPAGGERRDQDRHAPRGVDAREHRPHEGAAAAPGHQLRLAARDRDLPARVLQVQPVDLPEDVRARPGLPQALDRQLVPELQHGAGQRAGHRRRLLAVRLDGRRARSGAVVLPHHLLRRRAAQGTRDADRLAGEGRRHAAELDRTLRRRPREVPAARYRRRRRRRGVHDPHRHDLRRHLRRPRAGASDGRPAGEREPEPRGVPRPGGEVPRARSRSAARRLDREGRVRHRQKGAEPVQRRGRADLDRELRPGRVRDRRDHGRAGARRARLRVRPQVLAARARGRAVGRQGGRRRDDGRADDQLRARHQLRRVRRPGSAGGDHADDCRRREARHRHRRSAVPAEGLGHLAPALLGHADPDRPLREGRGRRRSV